ncbi:hypothetical protein ABZS61_09110 [Streptomyces sp. NPDC005566]
MAEENDDALALCGRLPTAPARTECSSGRTGSVPSPLSMLEPK